MTVDCGHGAEDSLSVSELGNGKWVQPGVSYIDPNRRFCDLCGRPIARRFWQVTVHDWKRIFCDPAHADLFTTYPQRQETFYS